MPAELDEKERVAKINDDGTWVLGKVKKVKVKEVIGVDGKPVASTVRCKWKASNGSAEYTKVRFAAADYNTDWVVFELAPKK